MMLAFFKSFEAPCTVNDKVWRVMMDFVGHVSCVKVESPQFRKATTAGRSKSFSNHRPLDPEVIAQVELSSQVGLMCVRVRVWMWVCVCIYCGLTHVCPLCVRT